MTVELRPIDRHNFGACVRLTVTPEQEHFVAANVYSIAHAYAEPECVPLAIYAGDQIGGFLMDALDADDHSYWIYRLMIDAQQQRKGYGRAAMQQAIDLIRQQPGCDQISIGYEPDNQVARQLYQSFGFRETGKTTGDETIARLRL